MKNQFIQKFLILLFIISFSLPRQSSSANAEGFTTIQEESIKAEIQHYFDAKYKAFSELSLNYFLDEYRDVKNKFIIDEQSKLRIEMKHSQVYNLKYEKYSYKLDYKSIVISENLAVVKLGESHEVVFPVFSPEKSYMSGLQHEITLQKESNTWKITKDVYQDYVWDLLQHTKFSLVDFEIKMLDTAKQKELDKPNSTRQNLPIQPTASFDRNGAKQYAYNYWQNWNNAYYAFTQDCTNFVSQALYVGGHIPMTPPQSGIGTSCWFWTDINNRAAAWAGTPNLFQFITGNESIFCGNKGPTGNEIYGASNVAVGDLIFFDWGDGGTDKDHVGIVVTWSAYSPGLATHTTNHYNYPYLSFDFFGSDFVHITN